MEKFWRVESFFASRVSRLQPRDPRTCRDCCCKLIVELLVCILVNRVLGNTLSSPRVLPEGQITFKPPQIWWTGWMCNIQALIPISIMKWEIPPCCLRAEPSFA